MRTPPQGFVNSLHGLDSLLSVYWGEIVQSWVIARKSAVPETELMLLRKRQARLERLLDTYDGHPNGLRKLKDTWVGVKEDLRAGYEGKRIILFAAELTPKIYDALVLADMTRYGGYARWADNLEAKEAAMEAKLERDMQEKRLALNKEAYDMLHHVWDKKSDKLAAGERDMKYLLHGKRSEVGEGPLISLSDF
jgi:hypothetical protein